jgi:hypothetical protein
MMVAVIYVPLEVGVEHDLLEFDALFPVDVFFRGFPDRSAPRRGETVGSAATDRHEDLNGSGRPVVVTRRCGPRRRACYRRRRHVL